MFCLFCGVWGVIAPRLPEDSCVSEARCAAHEYMVLSTALGTRATDQITLCTIIHLSY